MVADFIAGAIAKPMLSELAKKISNIVINNLEEKKCELADLQRDFPDFDVLMEYYVIPYYQQNNPLDSDNNTQIEPISAFINKWFSGFLPAGDGSRDLFLLADAGMGKTSFLCILKLLEIAGYWDSNYKCKLMKLSEDSLQKISEIENPQNTILLLDSLDEDPTCKKEGLEQRLTKLLDKTSSYYRVIISCRTQFFPQEKRKSIFSEVLGKVEYENYSCPAIYLTLFDNQQAEEYLKKRYPKALKDYLLLTERKEVINAKEIINRSDSILLRPFLLVHIEEILELEERLPIVKWGEMDDYYLYSFLIEKWFKREMTKLRKIDNVGSSIRDLRAYCFYIAEYMHVTEKDYLSKSVLDEVVDRSNRTIEHENHDIPSIFKEQIPGNSILNVDSFGNLWFSHPTFKEFLLVEGVRSRILNPEKPYTISGKIETFIKLANDPFVEDYFS